MAYADRGALGAIDWNTLLTQGLTAFSNVSTARLNYKTAKIQAAQGMPYPVDYTPQAQPQYTPPKSQGISTNTMLIVGAGLLAVFLIMQKKGR